jgi:hypothetical protein
MNLDPHVVYLRRGVKTNNGTMVTLLYRLVLTDDNIYRLWIVSKTVCRLVVRMSNVDIQQLIDSNHVIHGSLSIKIGPWVHKIRAKRTTALKVWYTGRLRNDTSVNNTRAPRPRDTFKRTKLRSK